VGKGTNLEKNNPGPQVHWWMECKFDKTITKSQDDETKESDESKNEEKNWVITILWESNDILEWARNMVENGKC
jgi:hypothetical protein